MDDTTNTASESPNPVSLDEIMQVIHLLRSTPIDFLKAHIAERYGVDFAKSVVILPAGFLDEMGVTLPRQNPLLADITVSPFVEDGKMIVMDKPSAFLPERAMDVLRRIG